MSLTVSDCAIGALRGVDLVVAPGEILCLSGPSGAGKSRLLRAIADLEPHTGVVACHAIRQHEVAAHAWRAMVMLVPADSAWWEHTVGAHFTQPPAAADLDALGLDHRIMDWETARLSSGERQRLALLRALTRTPRALLLDEPTANLDPASTLATERWLLARIRQQRLPTLWVAHDPEQIARVGDRHLTLRGERLEPA